MTIHRVYSEARIPTHRQQCYAATRAMMEARRLYPNACERHQEALIRALSRVEGSVRVEDGCVQAGAS